VVLDPELTGVFCPFRDKPWSELNKQETGQQNMAPSVLPPACSFPEHGCVGPPGPRPHLAVPEPVASFTLPSSNTDFGGLLNVCVMWHVSHFPYGAMRNTGEKM